VSEKRAQTLIIVTPTDASFSNEVPCTVKSVIAIL